jgi:hypothetical protein
MGLVLARPRGFPALCNCDDFQCSLASSLSEVRQKHLGDVADISTTGDLPEPHIAVLRVGFVPLHESHTSRTDDLRETLDDIPIAHHQGRLDAPLISRSARSHKERSFAFE